MKTYSETVNQQLTDALVTFDTKLGDGIVELGDSMKMIADMNEQLADLVDKLHERQND